ncbi:aminotransferase class IV [Staphylococcus caeli]|uniref:Para-aminobenzoate synthetase component n=1 Tax=Staphylococcus caeli TaxID=2201815 RepID=A0A1D4HMH1_9STAP|nr:aminotransferase class IV [Staphylococcus caeli]SCS28386.1 para-aminobenzoate synthetase component [Staphylococcus caeli]SCS38334.1 para-aminobenzoate synthetase component [Staphylococcus caeli]
MQLFETIRLDEGDFPRLSYHKSRMMRSAEALGFIFNEQQWTQCIETVLREHNTGKYRVKLLLNKDGTMDTVIAEMTDKQRFTAKLQQVVSQVNQHYIINKTSERAHLMHNYQTDLVLLYNEDGKILEFDIGNVMIKEKGQYFTPKYQEDFLRGCMRQEMLDQGKLFLKDYDVNELKSKLNSGEAQLFLINSLREVAEVEIYL